MNAAPVDAGEAFILANTAAMAPPHVPEITLRLADEAHDLWMRTEDELTTIGLPPPYWAFAWAGGQGLARYILDNPSEVRGRRVLDLASGSGLVAIAAARAGATHVIANDTDAFSIAAIALNAAFNHVTVEIDRRDLLADAGLALSLGADVVLAGDVFYDRAMAARVLALLRALSATGARVLVGDPGRSYLPRQALRHLIRYEVPVTRALEDAEIKRVDVFTIAEPETGRRISATS